ncbi:nucleotidyltransferase domain-containing protein [Sphingomonas sp. GB1N7]|uniref:nucleotidyltransferase domain-containing protein n=1 Tax=Parasphingomonas caseinilytica TaxID=3096158 RepID=UPI002FC944C2
MRGVSDPDRAEARTFSYLADVCGAVAADTPIAGVTPDDPAAIPALVRRHRIATRATAALATSLRPHDPEVAGWLSKRARGRSIAALHRTERMAAISTMLSAAGIRHFGIKGPVLAQQIYGDVGARDSKDIDLLVDPVTIARVATALETMGFAETSGHGEAGEQFANKHRTFVGHGVEVEVHTRLLDVDALLPLGFEAVWARRDTVMLGTVAVPALSMVDTLLYLCAHGAQHLWFRLKWLEDIARIVATAHPSIVPDAIVSARETGAEAIVTSAVQLVEEVFGIEGLSPIPISSASRRIVRLSKAALAAPADYASAPPLSWILRKLPVQFGMARNWRYRRDLLRLLLLAPRDFDATALPRGFRWLRLPLRPVMLLRDRWTRR